MHKPKNQLLNNDLHFSFLVLSNKAFINKIMMLMTLVDNNDVNFAK